MPPTGIPRACSTPSIQQYPHIQHYLLFSCSVPRNYSCISLPCDCRQGSLELLYVSLCILQRSTCTNGPLCGVLIRSSKLLCNFLCDRLLCFQHTELCSLRVLVGGMYGNGRMHIHTYTTPTQHRHNTITQHTCRAVLDRCKSCSTEIARLSNRAAC